MTANSSVTPHKYRADIDGLRAIAVLAVVAFHAFPNSLRGGFIGVDIFFVISGYLISTIIFENLDKGTFSFGEFYARRIRRIFPALILVLVTCFTFGWFILLADEFRQLGKHIAAGASFVSNLVLWSEAGYFDNSAETKPLLHLWSLGIEEQFYIIWPPLLWLAWKRGFNLLIIIIIVAIISFVLNIKGIKPDAVATFYSPQTRFWELLSGSLLAYFEFHQQVQPKNFTKTKSNIFSTIGFLIIILSIILINKDNPFPGWLAISPVLGASLIILAGNKSFVNSKILSNKIAVWFGLISFPLYLWHWPLLSLARIIVGEQPSPIIRISLVLLSILLAWLTYRFIERHIRFTKGYNYIMALILFGALMASLGGYVYISDGMSQRNAIVNSRFTEQARRQFVGPHWQYAKNDTCLNEYQFKDANKLAWWFCMKSDANKPTLAILGNSYANQLYPGFINNRLLNHHTVLSIGACEFAGIEPNVALDGNNPCFGNRTKEQREFIDNIVDTNTSIKFIIIDGLNRNPDAAYIERLQKRITNYESKDIKIILFTPHIKPSFHPKACFIMPLRRTAKDCTFPLADRQRLYDDFKPVIDALKKSNPNVLIFEQNQIFCENNTCSYVRNGMPLHRDEGHTSEYASIELQTYFTDWAKIYVPQIFDANFVRR